MCKRDSSIVKQMQADMIKAYCTVLKEHQCWTYEDACSKAVKLPAPRYYVTPKQAHMVISPMMKGDFEMVNLMMPLRRKMYYSLFDTVVKMTEQRQYADKSLWHIMKFAVLQPAPEFFIKPHTLYCTRLLMKQGNIDENGRRSVTPKQKPKNKNKKRV